MPPLSSIGLAQLPLHEAEGTDAARGVGKV